MEKIEFSENRITFYMWLAFTIFVGVVDVVNPIRAALGHCQWAWWHLFTFAACVLISCSMRSECKKEEKLESHNS